MLKGAGYTLISISFITGSYLSVIDAQEVDWTYLTIALAVGFLGVVLARLGSRAESTSEVMLESNMATVRSSLDRIVEQVSDLFDSREDIPTYEMSQEIDSRLLDHLNAFVESREVISHVFGLQAYADVMSHYAGGERYLNRVWSASADGYVDEVNAYIGHARTQFMEAQEKLNGLRKD
jgi:hypothetical protein